MTLSTPPRPRSSIIQQLVIAYNLWRQVQNNFPKKSRFTLGNKIDDLFITVLEPVYIANYLKSSQKLPYVQQAIRRLDLLKFFLQVAWEVKDMDNKKYLVLSESISDIGRMLGGWANNLKTTLKKTSTTQTSG